jgi:serine/threonine protein kinase
MAATPTRDACVRAAEELRQVAAVDEPRLVTLVDAGRVDASMFTAAHFETAGSMARPPAPLTRAQVLHAVADAARAAHALHEAGIVHRAIKSSNVMLDDSGGRLADVGLAHVLSPDDSMAAFGSVDDIEYVEPDVLLGQTAGRASDVWSLAVTLHRALTSSSVYGEVPNGGMLGTLRHVLETPPVLADGLSEGETELLSWCLAAERTKRPGTAAIVAERLDRLAVAA